MTPGTMAGSQEVAGDAPGKKYVCNVCGWIYDPAIGDPDGIIPPGTPFAALPEDWVCPVCGAPRSEFSLLEN
ncbi:MAG TPA: rubredoxin [Methanoregulaceae archaeon]|nr:rubredoxin [Methanoregulaceae archaeon]